MVNCAFLILWTIVQSSIASGEIGGTVRDPSGAVIPNVEITVVNQNTGLTRRTTTDELGSYRALLLPPGVYQVKAEREKFAGQVREPVRVTIGETSIIDFDLMIGISVQTEVVVAAAPLVETERVQQSNTIREEQIRQLPIDRRDYLTYTLLAPGVVDSKALADASDYRVPQTRDSGLSFYGSNGRGNSVTMDGGDANDFAGGVRETISQEAVQEFQINRGNYSAEFGGASGAVINIVSKSGTNEHHGSAYGFFRHDRLDAADPFSTALVNGRAQRVDPPSNRQQFGATWGGPWKTGRTFHFASFEGLRRRESNAVPVLTDLSIFGPTPDQERVLGGLPAAAAVPLRAALTAPQSTRDLFERNGGVFPFRTSDYKFSVRLDHNISERNQLMFRTNYSNVDETNPNTKALVGFSRGYNIDILDSTNLLTWTSIGGPRTVNQFRAQFDYRNFYVSTTDRFGPEFNINGYGFFNRDAFLPSNTISRDIELGDSLSLIRGAHYLKVGGQSKIRGTHSETQVFLGARFGFGPLPGALVSPALAATSLTGLQAFNLGLAQFYQQGFGYATVASTIPFYALYLQDTWKVRNNLTLNLGLRYELDDRTDPISTDKNNVAPRIGLAWDPGNNSKTTVRAGFGVYYTPDYYQLDFVSKALNDIDGHRQIAQILTTIQTPGVASAANIYGTLVRQGVITFPFPARAITAADIAQFGLRPVHDGPIPPSTVVFRNAGDFVSAYSMQSSLGIDRALSNDLSIGVSYLFARTLKIIRARDQNLLPAPVDPVLGVRVWSTPYFKNPLLLQDNLYESSGNAFYHGAVFELTKTFSRRLAANVNYTLSKAIDEVVDFNSDFQANDLLNMRAERSLSSFDQRHKVVVNGTVDVGGGASLSGIFRANSARPFNLLVGTDLNADRHSTTDRPPFAGRNTGIGPNFWTIDLRATKRLRFGERTSLEVMAEAFNIFNRFNFQSVNNTVGNIKGPFDLKARKDRGPSEPLGFTSAFDPRRIQLGTRFNF